MQVRYEKHGRTDTNRTTKQAREPIDKAYFICQTYNRTGVGTCSSHKIEARDLHELILADIQGLAQTALADADSFYDRLAEKLESRHSGDTAHIKKELDALQERSAEIDALYMSLYEDKAKGVVTEQRFRMMTEKLDAEQSAAKEHAQQLVAALNEADSQQHDIEFFMDELLKFSEITELDEVVTHRLIEKIIVEEPQIVDGEKIQKVRIVYNFVGAVTE